METGCLWIIPMSHRPNSANQWPWGNSVPSHGRVALVDDDQELRLSLGGLLRSYGIDALLFESATALLAKDQLPFDCIIADVHMPGIDGISMIKRLRDRGNEVPVIIISALDPDRTRDQAMAGGARAYFSKPVDTAALLDVIAKLTS